MSGAGGQSDAFSIYRHQSGGDFGANHDHFGANTSSLGAKCPGQGVAQKERTNIRTQPF